MRRELEPWGGEVHLPGWMSRLLRRLPEPTDTPERTHEARAHPPDLPSVLENADRAAVGPLTQLYNEGRTGRR